MSTPNDPNPVDALYDDRPSRTGAAWFRVKFWMRRFWWIVALMTMIGLGVMDVLIYNTTPTYISYAEMMGNGHVNLQGGQLYDPTLTMASFFPTQVSIMKSNSILNQAVDRVSQLHPEVSADRDAKVDASLELRAAVFDLTVTSTDPDYAKILLDSVMDTYLDSKRQLRNQAMGEAVSATIEGVAKYKAETDADEQATLDFQKANNVVGIEEQSSNAATYLVSLKRELAQTQKDYDYLSLIDKDPLASSVNDNPLDTRLAPSVVESAPGEAAQNAAGPTPPTNSYEQNTEVINAQQDKVDKLKIEQQQLGQYLKDAHPKMKNLADEIEQEEKFLETLKTRNATDRDQRLEEMKLAIQNLNNQIKVWEGKSLDLSQRLGAYQLLKDKQARDQGIFDRFSASIANIDLEKLVGQDDVVIWQAASRAVPVKHNFFLWLAAGGVAGGVLGFLMALGLVLLDDKINSPLDIDEHFDFPLLGEIPLARLDRKTRRVPLLTEDDDRFEFLEHHRDIRSSLFFGASEAARPRSLVITSAAPGEGKSTLAANLAATFAFSGINVLLIDADLRRGIQHQIFGLPIKPGLSNYLMGEVHWKEVVRSTKIPNLDLLPRGKITTRVGDLLLTAAADYLIQESLMDYDMVLWDTAPLFAAHDAADLCSRVEGILFMARVRHSSTHLVKAALGDLVRRNAKVTGIVLNAVKAGQPGYYSKYRYKEYSSTSP